jgi:haloacid dehalogenase superfamily, subfamily IA, variant 1 with third motif having Dx(3-4)D or Dx(3-4)E
MNKKAIIWDFDGTIIDSYPVIVRSLKNTLSEKGIQYNDDNIFQFVKEKSVHQFIQQISYDYKIPLEELKHRYSEISKRGQRNLNLMPNAKEILERLTWQGVKNYIYTHKGPSVFEVVKEKGIQDYFEEIVSSGNGFKRKPDPEALLYLIDKYSLEKADTFYIGDRPLDVECACNAEIKSILFVTDDEGYEAKVKPDYIIHDLMEIDLI